MATAEPQPFSQRRRPLWLMAALRRAVLLGAVCGWFLSGVRLIHRHAVTSRGAADESGWADASVLPWREPLGEGQLRRQVRSEPAPAASQSTDAAPSTAASPGSPVRLPRVLALYFPQFHRDPLNDRLWGAGFTDWVSLRAAPAANRLGFALPRPLPEVGPDAAESGDRGGGLGYYDLRNATVRRRQAELARRYGVDGFVYHHYWFYDKEDAAAQDPPVSAPLRALLRDGQPDLPFCLHWANTGWSRQWNRATADNETAAAGAWLKEQRFPRPTATAANGSDYKDSRVDKDEDWVAEVKRHYAWLRPFFHHPNYIRVDGAPVFMVYMWFLESVPALQLLRRLAVADGFPGLYLTVGLSMTHDALFPPGSRLGQRRWRPAFDGLVNATVAYPYPLKQLQGRTLRVPEWCRRGTAAVDPRAAAPPVRAPVVPGVVAAFDNTPRRPFAEAVIWSADAPERVRRRFQASLTAAVYHEACCRGAPGDGPPDDSLRRDVPDDDRFVLVNAWNEWAEGMALEPSTVFGHGLLVAVAAAKARVWAAQCRWRLLSPPGDSGDDIGDALDA